MVLPNGRLLYRLRFDTYDDRFDTDHFESVIPYNEGDELRLRNGCPNDACFWVVERFEAGRAGEPDTLHCVEYVRA
jgi:hypothetical protein